jgi:antitoxin (DNA-binding transcriptional repressor) of toxin-antitoxin stability system
VGNVDVSEAMTTLSDLLDRVASGEDVTITRHRKPVALLVRPNQLRVRRASTTVEMAAGLGRLLQEARDLPLDAGVGLSSKYAEEFVADVRASREELDPTRVTGM